MHRCHGSNRFNFDDDATVHDYICSVAAIELNSAVDNRNGLLPLEEQVCSASSSQGHSS
jgi:hypothetical protein